VSESQFFTGPALLALFETTTVAGAGETQVGQLTVKYRPNQINRSMLDIIEPRLGDARGPARLAAADLVTSRDVFVYLGSEVLLLDVKAGTLGPVPIPSNSHVLWVIPKDAITSPQDISKKKLLGGTKNAGISFLVQSKSKPDVSRKVELGFLSDRDTQALGAWLKRPAA
jgi:hypothetical protein